VTVIATSRIKTLLGRAGLPKIADVRVIAV
jgi:hypothetical protein